MRTELFKHLIKKGLPITGVEVILATGVQLHSRECLSQVFKSFRLLLQLTFQ